jgi:hypothetical protein
MRSGLRGALLAFLAAIYVYIELIGFATAFSSSPSIGRITKITPVFGRYEFKANSLILGYESSMSYSCSTRSELALFNRFYKPRFISTKRVDALLEEIKNTKDKSVSLVCEAEKNKANIYPEVVYVNADLDKSKILAKSLRVVCVYRWVNKINGDEYVGSTTNLRVRLYTYYSLGSLSQSKRIIDRALLKYGYSNFRFEILEYCTKNNVIEREQYYIDLLKPIYNIVKIAGSTLGYKHSLETKEKMKNLSISDEVRKVRLESVAKASEVNRVKVLVVNIKTKEMIEYPSMTEAGRVLGVNKNNIGNAIKNKRVIKKTYICRLAEDNLILDEEVRIANIKSGIKQGETSKVKVIVENLKTKERIEYSSMTEAGIAINVHKTNIGKAIKKKSIIKKTYICYLHSG